MSAIKGESILDRWWISTLLLLVLLAGVIALWMYLPGYLTKDLKTTEERGVFGDSYGSVNALFTGLAFAGLIFTILLQQREIKLQREDFAEQIQEMQLSREEISRQADLQEEQLRLSRQQLKLSLAQLKMNSFDAAISEIEMRSYAWRDNDKATKMAPEIKQVQAKMEQEIEALIAAWKAEQGGGGQADTRTEST